MIVVSSDNFHPLVIGSMPCSQAWYFFHLHFGVVFHTFPVISFCSGIAVATCHCRTAFCRSCRQLWEGGRVDCFGEFLPHPTRHWPDTRATGTAAACRLEQVGCRHAKLQPLPVCRGSARGASREGISMEEKHLWGLAIVNHVLK